MNRPLVLLDSIAVIDATAQDAVVVSGSHGGASAAKFVLQLGARLPRAVFYNDAGVGKDRAGIVALNMLEAVDLACATYSHESACIGNAEDGYLSGVVSHVNAPAAASGVQPGDRVRDAVQRLSAGAAGA